MLGKQPIFTIHAELEAVTNLGRTPYGERRMIGILGGSVRGPRLSGRILPGGTDWQIIRSDGAADIKARYTIESDAGALIMVTSEGLRHGPARHHREASPVRRPRSMTTFSPIPITRPAA
jgi:uncharacterized protein DUF3237